METLLGKNLRNRDFEEIGIEKLKEAQLVGLYFSSRNCPPSKKFSDLLLEFYQEINCDAYHFEIVWMSVDSEEEEYKKTMTKIPWLSLPYNDPKIKDIISKFGVTSIPKLLILTPNGTKVTEEGRTDICQKGEVAFEKWSKMIPINSA